MPNSIAPVINAEKAFYCDCVDRETTWLCKAQPGGMALGRRGEPITWGLHRYWWQCMNCGKRRTIGVWSDNSEYVDPGDGRPLISPS